MAAPPRAEALAILEQSHQTLDGLIAQMDDAALARSGLGGGEWSPLDLIGHIAFWESMALSAAADWRAGRPAQIWNQFGPEGVGMDALNAANVESNRALPPATLREQARATYAEIVRLIETMTDEEWNADAPGGETPHAVGEHLGALMGADDGPFRHGNAHLADLEAFVRGVSVPG